MAAQYIVITRSLYNDSLKNDVSMFSNAVIICINTTMLGIFISIDNTPSTSQRK